MTCGALNSFLFSELMFQGLILGNVCDVMGSESAFRGTHEMNFLMYVLRFKSVVLRYSASNIILCLGLVLLVQVSYLK